MEKRVYQYFTIVLSQSFCLCMYVNEYVICNYRNLNMANTTVTGAQAIHGQNPQVYLLIMVNLPFPLICLVSSGNCNQKPNL